MMTGLDVQTERSASAQLTLAEILTAATARLAQAGIYTPQLDAELLLARACGVSRTGLLGRLSETLSNDTAVAFATTLARRLEREPLAYILGFQEFWSLEFQVTPDVLVPRPETELLVEIATSLLNGAARPRVADIGTGSGCIAIALARELPTVETWATDTSRAALDVARQNAVRLGVADRVHLAAGDLLAPLTATGPFDLVCSNPPYVASADAPSLQAELGYEPAQALFAGTDGLAVIGRLITEASRFLVDGGWLLVEIGSGQGPAALKLASAAAFDGAEVRNDYAGMPRVLVMRK